MKKNTPPPPQKNGWLIMSLIFFTLAVFLFILIQTVPACSTQQPRADTILNVSPSISNKKLVYKGEPVDKSKLYYLIQIWLKLYLESVSSDFGSGKRIGPLISKNISVCPKNMLIYDAKLHPEHKGFILKIVLEPPKLLVNWDNEEYTKFYPSLNPYIHVMELEYIWVWSDKPQFNLTLSKLDFQMVDWKYNSYHKNYKDTKNSPLYKMEIPKPHNWSKEEILVFLTTMGLFNTITVIQSDLALEDIQGSSIEKTTA